MENGYEGSEEEYYANGGDVCACCGSVNCQQVVDDSKVKASKKKARNVWAFGMEVD